MEQSMKSRYLTLPFNRKEAIWTCPTCGVIQPIQLSFYGSTRYARRPCTCEEKAKQEQEHALLLAEQRRVYQEAQSNHIYCWLGREWSDSSLREKTFEMFDPDLQPKAYDAAQVFTEDLKGTLVLYGTYGTGKTHLLAAICNDILKRRNIPSVFTSAPVLFRAIQARIAQNVGHEDIIKKAINARLLVIDDVDKANHTPARESIYFTIIDERVKAGRPIAISTNKLNELAQYVGGAACSRLKIGQIPVAMNGDDYRVSL